MTRLRRLWRYAITAAALVGFGLAAGASGNWR
jgi:hypothetical protein